MRILEILQVLFLLILQLSLITSVEFAGDGVANTNLDLEGVYKQHLLDLENNSIDQLNKNNNPISSSLSSENAAFNNGQIYDQTMKTGPQNGLNLDQNNIDFLTELPKY